MTPEKYKQVKDIFLAACDKPRSDQPAYIEKSAAGDDEIKREVESLLHEHRRETQVMPSEPESPLGSMSALLSRAHLEMDENAAEKAEPVMQKGTAQAAATPAAKPERRQQITEFLDDSALGSSTGSGFIDAGRFMAGTMVAGRYRIIELLGRGGMGEVYRADDTTLSQSIALKFLPTLFGSDEKWLERFRNEVRLARQVTHPNVCRVFDIGVFEGEQFISMEYVDGEDLASLLRRIGRVPHDKALQIARQLCAGLAAAHDKGVLHRDLKPANVMIDGRGSVRITDFGLAAPADQMRKDAIRAGTPAYMSPEQLAGRGVTVRSDVYSLGLLLYEMFTGRRAFKGATLREYQKLHSSEEPTPPSKIIEDIDPIVERVILKCLEKDPKLRPASAMAVSAGLPGGNPLREILAAGDTPSPEVVAAAGAAHGGLDPRRATGYLVAGLLSLVLVVLLAPQAFLIQLAVREKSPVVLTDKAATLLHEKLGYPVLKDKASGFSLNRSYYDHVQQTQKQFDRWRKLIQPDPGMAVFWYRESPELLVPLQPDSAVQQNDPPALQPGSARVTLDPRGRLVGLEVHPGGPAGAPPLKPARPDTPPATAGAIPSELPADAVNPPWARPLLDAAGFEPENLTAAPLRDVPPVYADARAAWDVILSGEKMHIEAAAFEGRPVYFALLGQWKQEQFASTRAQQLNLPSINAYLRTLLIASLLVAGSFLAWRNYRSGRGDRAGAMRMAIAFFGFGLIAWALRAHHVPDILQEFSLFQRAAGAILYPVVIIWIFYLALEPHIRRVWPETVISWSRLLSGKWFDPLVGRDVLIGSAFGALAMVLQALDLLLPRWLGFPAPLPMAESTSRMLGALTNFSVLFSGPIFALQVALILLLLLVLMRLMLRRKILVYAAFVILFVAPQARWGDADYVSYVIQIITAIVFLALLVRHGLVALVFCLLVRNLLAEFPVTSDLSLWYASGAAAGLGAAILLLLFSFYAALGGRSPISIRGLET